MVRLVAVWCPALSREGPTGEEPRRFAEVLDAAVALAPFARPVRLGRAHDPLQGAEPVLRRRGGVRRAARAHAVGPLLGGAGRVCVGAAEGLFAAVLAARASVLVPAGRDRRVPRAVVDRHAARPRPRRGVPAARAAHPRPVRAARGGPRARALRPRRGAAPPRRAGRRRRAAGAARPPRRCAGSTRCAAATSRREVQRGFFGERGGGGRCAPPRPRSGSSASSALGAVTVARLGGGRAPDDRAVARAVGER